MPYFGQKYAVHYYGSKNNREIPLHFYIAGTKYNKENVKLLTIGSRLQLKPEPTNPYNPEAIAIYYNDCLCGYVPNKFIDDVKKHLDDYIMQTCEIKEYEDYLTVNVALYDHLSFYTQ